MRKNLYDLANWLLGPLCDWGWANHSPGIGCLRRAKWTPKEPFEGERPSDRWVRWCDKHREAMDPAGTRYGPLAAAHTPDGETTP